MALPPEEGGIAVDVPAYKASHEIGLDKEQQSYWNGLLYVWMPDLFLFPILIFDQNYFSCVVVHSYGSIGRFRKSTWADLSAID